MASEKQIIVDIKGGDVKIDAKGFVGGACLKETASLEAALGKVEARTEKPELYTASGTEKLTVGSK